MPRAALRVELDGAEAFDVDVGVVPLRAVAARRRRLHLRVEPIGERREAAQQQHRRPRGERGRAASGRRHRGHQVPAVRRARRRPRRVRALRGEDQLGQLAHRARAALARRDVVRVLAHRGRRVRNRRREAARAHDGTSGRSSPMCAHASGAKPSSARSAFHGVQLVGDVEHDVRDVRAGGRDARRPAPGCR